MASEPTDEMVEAARKHLPPHMHPNMVRAALTAALAMLEREHVMLGRTHYDALIQDHQELTAMLAASQEPKP